MLTLTQMQKIEQRLREYAMYREQEGDTETAAQALDAAAQMTEQRAVVVANLLWEPGN